MKERENAINIKVNLSEGLNVYSQNSPDQTKTKAPQYALTPLLGTDNGQNNDG